MSSSTLVEQVRYIVISPVRNEEQYLETTIKAVIAQTVRPLQWILVDDGSTDRTAEIIDRWASEQSWIVAVHRLDHARQDSVGDVSSENRMRRGKRAREAKEIVAFYDGYAQIEMADWDYLVKLDGDLGFMPDYFERCFEEFARDPKLGIGGGDICNPVNGEWKVEANPRFHVRGATKIYRRACWDAIEGVEAGAGWDTLDEVKANMKNWNTRSFPGLHVQHYRPTGAANGQWLNAIKKGEWNYISGYHPLFFIAKCVRNVFRKPYLVGSAGLLCGFTHGLLQRVPQVGDKALIGYLQRQQLRRLFLRPTIWR
jgi:glycosyltransferase involved in cell wall biosynthesis